MPELPEVEAVRRYLDSQGIVGRTITGIELLWPGAVRKPPPERLDALLAGRRISKVRRRGKYLVLPLEGAPSRALVLHLGMTGALLVQPVGRERPRHTRNVFLLDGGLELCFVDPRKLGTVRLVAAEAGPLSALGPEPLSPEFTPDALLARLTRREAPIKALLCDQGIVAGLGNIYADEVLFLARIHPLTPGGAVSSRQARRLHEAIVTRLPEAIELLAPPRGDEGRPGNAEALPEMLLVPRKEGAPCRRCGGSIRRVVVRGRSAYFCARQQRKARDGVRGTGFGVPGT